MYNEEFNPEKLIDKYSNFIYSIAIRYLKNRENAEDIVQEVFVRYIDQLHKRISFNDKEHEKNWIAKVTINLCFNELKKQKNRKNVPLDNEIVYTFEVRQEYYIYDEVQKLPLKYRSVFELFYFDDMKISEISKILNISESNVKTRLKRTREMLKKRLTEQDALDEDFV